jgi:hypothetical protein
MQMHQIMMAVCVHRHVPAVPDHAPQPELIRQCFAFNPADRPTAAALATALALDAEGLSLVAKIAELTAERDGAVRDVETLHADAVVSRRIQEAHFAERAVLERALEATRAALATSEQTQRELTAERDTARMDSIEDQVELTAALDELNQLQRQHGREEIPDPVEEPGQKGFGLEGSKPEDGIQDPNSLKTIQLIKVGLERRELTFWICNRDHPAATPCDVDVAAIASCLIYQHGTPGTSLLQDEIGIIETEILEWKEGRADGEELLSGDPVHSEMIDKRLRLKMQVRTISLQSFSYLNYSHSRHHGIADITNMQE